MRDDTKRAVRDPRFNAGLVLVVHQLMEMMALKEVTVNVHDSAKDATGAMFSVDYETGEFNIKIIPLGEFPE